MTTVAPTSTNPITGTTSTTTVCVATRKVVTAGTTSVPPNRTAPAPGRPARHTTVAAPSNPTSSSGPEAEPTTRYGSSIHGAKVRGTPSISNKCGTVHTAPSTTRIGQDHRGDSCQASNASTRTTSGPYTSTPSVTMPTGLNRALMPNWLMMPRYATASPPS